MDPRASLDILRKRMEYVLTEALIVSVIGRDLVCCCSSILLNVVTMTDAALHVVMQDESFDDVKELCLQQQPQC